MVMAWKTKKVKKDLIILAVILLWGLWEVVFEFEDVKKVIFSGYSNEPLIDMYNKKVWEELQNE